MSTDYLSGLFSKIMLNIDGECWSHSLSPFSTFLFHFFLFFDKQNDEAKHNNSPLPADLSVYYLTFPFDTQRQRGKWW